MATLVMTQRCHHHHHHLAPMSMMMKVMMKTANDNNRFNNNKMTMAVMMDPEYLAWYSTSYGYSSSMMWAHPTRKASDGLSSNHGNEPIRMHDLA
jgi:hypothetical protein